MENKILTKTQIRIMEILTAGIAKRFSVMQISKLLGKPYALVFNSVKFLIESGLLEKDHNLISLNYKSDHSELAYAESIRKDEFLSKNKTIKLFVKDSLESIKTDFFCMLIFGSYAENKQQKGSDVDVLVICEDDYKHSNMEKILENLASKFSLNFHIHVIPAKSAYEMLLKRDEANVMNELLNSHIIIFGGENFYRMLKNAG